MLSHTPDQHPVRANSRVLAAAMVGSTIEYYDFFIYATAAALVFGPLFFPQQSPSAQTMLSLLTFGVAFVARPVGAVLFGHFGDRVGRKTTLVAALLTMGFSTVAIAFLPTYAAAGWIAPALLCLLRFGQGLGLGGEWGGAALLAVENAPPGWRARFAGFPQFGAPLGLILANGLFLILSLSLSKDDFTVWGWRLPFLLSAVLVGVGLWVRLRIGETRAFIAAAEAEPAAHVPIARLFADHGRAVVFGTAGALATFAAFYLTTAFALAQATNQLGYPREPFLALQLVAYLFYGAGIIIGATHADRTSPATTIRGGAIGLVFIGLLFGPGLSFGGIALAGVTLSISMLVLGYGNAALGAWLSQLFPVRLRYSGISLTFNMGAIIGGAITPLVAQQLSSHGHPGLTGLLLSLGAAIAVVGTRLGRTDHD